MRSLKQILKTCKQFGIYSYYVKNSKLFITQDINMTAQGLLKFPFEPGEIKYMKGDLLIRNNNLKDCVGFPERVDGVIDISYNANISFTGISYKAFRLLAHNCRIKQFDNSIKFLKVLSIDSIEFINYAPQMYDYSYIDFGKSIDTNNLENKQSFNIWYVLNKNNLWNPTLNLLENLNIAARKIPKIVFEKDWILNNQITNNVSLKLLNELEMF